MMKRQDRDIEYQSVILEKDNKDIKGRLREIHQLRQMRFVRRLIIG